MNELQQKQLEILAEFVKFCDEHNLLYFASSGTCLGAIRHKGFIPWDDDIDVMMPRKDYEKLLKLGHLWKGSKYFLQTYETDKHYTLNFAKLRDSTTTFVENFYALHRMNHGVWIDIFPMDGTSMEEKPKSMRKYKRRCNRTWVNVWLMFCYGCRRKIRARSFFKDIGLNILAYLFFWTNVGHYRNKMMDRWVQKIDYDKAALVGIAYTTLARESMIPKRAFDTVKKVPFENIMINVPGDYDLYLSTTYGDYMTPPPVEQQEGHHHNKGLDLHMGYDEYCRKHRM